MAPRCTTALLAVLLLCPLLAAADARRDYQAGLDALEDGELAKARASLESAIAEDPESKARIRTYGMRFVPYLPHFYLGETLYQLGDCQGAIAAWDEALARGVIAGMEEVSTLQRNRSACQARVVDVSAIAATARNGLEALGESLRDLERLRGDTLLESEWAARDEWSTALEDGQSGQARLREALEAAAAARDAETIETIIAEAETLRTRAQQATGAAGQRLAALQARQERELAQAQQRARSELASALASARQLLSASPPDAASRSAQAELATLVEQGDALASDASTGRMNQLSRRLSATARNFRSAVQDFENRQRAIAERTPPDGLRRLAEAYFAGRYNEAARLADPAAFDSERARIQALLFRAASRFNQYTLGGASSRDLLAEVERDIRAIKALDDDFAPYVAAFPPKFAELFQQTL